MMFRNKIAIKLVAGISCFVIICVFLLGLLFINIFADNHIKFRTEALMKTARQISNLPELSQMDNSKTLSENKLLELLDFSADARIWIVDKNMNIVVRSVGDIDEHHEMGNCLLPQNDMNFMAGVLSGTEMVSYDNTAFYDVAMLSVGVPIYNGGKIVGAVLLHSSIEALGAFVRQTAWYLSLAILLSTLIIIVAVWFYAASFTKPLKIMKDVARKMIDGDYSVYTNISKADEIGDLANSIDILAKRLEKAREETEKLEQIRRDFVANVSHEFRTPLTVVKGNLETLIDTKVADADVYYNIMLAEIDALEKLVSDLLDLSRIESGKLDFDIEEIDVRSLVSDIVRSIIPVAAEKNITIDVSQASEVIPPINSDYYRLRQILIIFLSNAIKYSYENKTISISIKVSDNLTIMIKDQGIGIDKSDIPYVWDRFFKSDKMRSDKTSTGLGLAIAKNLTVALGGAVSLESELDLGTTVMITLPLVKEA